MPAEIDPARLGNLVVLIGHGRVGQALTERLREAGIPVIVADRDRERVEALRAIGVPAVCGDATEPGVLVQAHVARARLLVVATIDAFDVRRVATLARELNPAIEIVVRSASTAEADQLAREAYGRIFVAEAELAQGMAAYVITRWQAA